MMRTKIVFRLRLETELPQDVIDAAPSMGPFDNYAEYLIENYDVQCPEEDARLFLKGYGAWDETDLSDHEANLQRILWLACLNCKEEKTPYFYMGE